MRLLEPRFGGAFTLLSSRLSGFDPACAGYASRIERFAVDSDVRLPIRVVHEPRPCLATSSRAALPLDFRLRGGGDGRSGWVDPGGARPPVHMNVCIPTRGFGFVEVTLTTHPAVRIPDGRLVGLHLDRVSANPRTAGC
jgi:hypothetical protein